MMMPFAALPLAVDGGGALDDSVLPLREAGDLDGGPVGDLLVQAQ